MRSKKELVALDQFYKNLRQIPSLRVIHDLKFRQRISSVELITRCVIAGTDSTIEIADAFGPDKSLKVVNGTFIEWSVDMEKKSAEYILKVILDSSSWMVSFIDNTILIHRYRT